MRLGAALVIAAAGVAVIAAQSAQQPTFRGGARFVRVDVYPTDPEGRPISGLAADDFEVFEDDKPQVIDTFEFVRVEPEPEGERVDPDSQAAGEAMAKDPRARVFGIVLDTGHVEVGGSRELQRPLVGMLDRLIGPRDLFGVISTQLPPSSFVLGRRTTTVADMMAKYWAWGTYDQTSPQNPVEDLFDSCFGPVTHNSPNPAQPSSSRFTRELIARHRERQTLEFLDKLVDKMAAIREERKFLIVVTQGWRLFGPNESMLEEVVRSAGGAAPGVVVERGRIFSGGRPVDANPEVPRDRASCATEATGLLMMDSRTRHRQLMEKAQRANVAFYPIDPRGLTPFDQPISHGVISGAEESSRLKARIAGLEELAANTDGRAFVLSNQMEVQFQQLADSLTTYYLLGYYSTNTKFDGGYRKLTVKVKRPGVRLTARRGYVAPTEAEIAAIADGRAAANRPPTAEAAALSDALSRLEELRHDRDVFVQTARAGGDIVVNVEIGANARSSPAWAEGGVVRIRPVGTGDEATVEAAIAPMRSGVSVRIPAVEMKEMRLDVRARAKQAGPSAAAETTAIVPASSSVLLGELMAYRGIARALFPAADGRYRRTERATLEAPLGEGAVPVGARVLDRAGTPLPLPVTTSARVDAAGVRWIRAEVSLAPLTDGDYVIELEAMKDETRERKLFAVRVVR